MSPIRRTSNPVPGPLARTARGRTALVGACLAALALALASPSVAADPPGEITFIGQNAVLTANGAFHRFAIAEQNVDLADLPASFVVVEVDVASVDTGIEQRDEHLRTADFFDVERFPTATVRVHSARPNGADAGGHPRYAATFDLTLLGTTKSVDGAFTVLGESPLTVEGELTVDRTQWGIGEPKSWYNPLSLENEIPIRFRATLEPR